MEETNYQERFNKFKDGVFKYIIKSDLIKLGDSEGIKVDDVILDDYFVVNDYSKKIYPMFTVIYDGSYYISDRRRVQEMFAERIEKSLDMFYPSGEFNILAANIYFKKL